MQVCDEQNEAQHRDPVLGFARFRTVLHQPSYEMQIKAVSILSEHLLRNAHIQRNTQQNVEWESHAQ